MPRISAATVAEHRAAQRKALLAAAAELVLADGVSGVNPKTVGERAGIARSSVYEYFSSREEILVAIAIQAFEEWARELSAALDGVELGLPRLRRYIDATMEMASDGRHGLANALRDAELSPTSREELSALHNALIRPLVGVLDEAGLERPMEFAPLIQAVIGAGLERASGAADPAVVAEQVYGMIVAGAPFAATDR